MSDIFMVYTNMPAIARGLLLFPFGLVVGSFANVVWYRWRLGQSVVTPRSHCSHCRTTLMARDLVPVFSYLLLKGRCRYCSTRIGWQCPGSELLCGVAAGLACGLGGWLWGLGALILWIVGTGLFARTVPMFRKRFRSQAGFTLLEVVISFALLTLVLVPVLDTISAARHTGVAAQRRTLGVALVRARIQEISATALQSPGGLGQVDGWSHQTISGEAVSGEPELAPYQVTTVVDNPYPRPGIGDRLRRVTVTVACPTCQGKFGAPFPPVTITTVVRGR